MEAAVVARSDEKWGETPCAFVTLKPGAKPVTADDIIAYCREHMARYKVPRTVVFGPLPKTSTGKIQKFVLRERRRHCEPARPACHDPGSDESIDARWPSTRPSTPRRCDVLTDVSGTFVKIAFADAGDIALARGISDRPLARFNRRGQDALYLSPDEDSARVAIGEYVTADNPARVLLRFEVELCSLLDLRHPEAALLCEQARQSWKRAIANGEEPSSWAAADHIRSLGHVGLIDPSRRRPGLWHITLFRWNEAGAPRVQKIGAPVPIEVLTDYR